MKKRLLLVSILGLLIFSLSLNYPAGFAEIVKDKIMKSPVSDPSAIMLTPEDMPGYIPPDVAGKRLVEDFKRRHSALEFEYYKKLHEKKSKGRLYVETTAIYLDHDYRQDPQPWPENRLNNKNGYNFIEAFSQSWGKEGWLVDDKEKRWGIGYAASIQYTFYPDVSSAIYSLDWLLTFGQQEFPFAMVGGLSEAEKMERYYRLKKIRDSHIKAKYGIKSDRKGPQISAPPIGDESWEGDSWMYLRVGRVVVLLSASDYELRKIAKIIADKIVRSKLY
jgi:hypothetical protein